MAVMQLNLRSVFAVDEARADIHCRFDLSHDEYPAGYFPFREPVLVSGCVENRMGTVYLVVKISFAYFTFCDRCGSEVTERYCVNIENIVKNNAVGDEDEDIIPIKDYRLDLEAVVVENMLLKLPMKHLCRPDCKGLCPVCGHNLNDSECGHVK